MKTDWFRKTTWSEADQSDFDTRLKRCRTIYNKAQYARIQANHLQHAKPPLYTEALALLERVLAEFPDQSQTASALLQKAECIQALHDLTKAAPFFRASLQAEAEYPRVGTRAWINFPWQIVLNRQVELYPEAMAILEKRSSEILFHVDKFQANAVLAFVKKHAGDIATARVYARNALNSAQQEHSGFRYHPDIGLVQGIVPWVEAELQTLAG